MIFDSIIKGMFPLEMTQGLIVLLLKRGKK